MAEEISDEKIIKHISQTKLSSLANPIPVSLWRRVVLYFKNKYKSLFNWYIERKLEHELINKSTPERINRIFKHSNFDYGDSLKVRSYVPPIKHDNNGQSLEKITAEKIYDGLLPDPWFNKKNITVKSTVPNWQIDENCKVKEFDDEKGESKIIGQF